VSSDVFADHPAMRPAEAPDSTPTRKSGLVGSSQRAD